MDGEVVDGVRLSRVDGCENEKWLALAGVLGTDPVTGDFGPGSCPPGCVSGRSPNPGSGRIMEPVASENSAELD